MLVRRGRCPRSGAKRNKYPWGTPPTVLPPHPLPFRRGRCPHRPAVSPPHPLRCSVGADDSVRPNTAQRCHSHASDRRHWRGNPSPAPAGAESLPPSAREVARSAGGRDMPRHTGRCGHRPLRTVYRKRMRIPPGGQSRPPLHPVSQRQMHYQNQTSGQRPLPTFAASRQRRDLIIATPQG